MNEGVVVLTGGVGGAKLVDGLYRTLPPGRLTAIVNTGDDFEHLGLYISPDIDSLLYLLSGQNNRELGWGRAGETWNFMAALKGLGAPDWFNLGDGDLALHVLRAEALRSGESLTAITKRFVAAWNLSLEVYPMSDSPVGTWLDTGDGEMPFQEYFVARQCQPTVNTITYNGAEQAVPPPQALRALQEAGAIIIAPSNPWLSIAPILAVPAIRKAMKESNVPVVAVSPLVGGQAVKGPTAKLMTELGLTVRNCDIAEFYDGLLDAMLFHEGDDAPSSLHVASCNTRMYDETDRIFVADNVLALAARITR